MSELLARIRNLLRRGMVTQVVHLRVGDLELDPFTRIAWDVWRETGRATPWYRLTV